MCGLVLGFHSVIMQHPDVPKMLCWRKRHIKTDISNRIKPCLVVARDELDQMFPNLPQAVLPAEFSIMVRSEPRLMSFWQGGVLMEKISTWAFARGSGNTFRDCQCHDLLESFYFWTLSPVKLPSAADCFPSALPQSPIMPVHWALVLDILCSWYLLEASFIYPPGWIWNSTWPSIFPIDGRTQSMRLQDSESLQMKSFQLSFPQGSWPWSCNK